MDLVGVQVNHGCCQRLCISPFPAHTYSYMKSCAPAVEYANKQLLNRTVVHFNMPSIADVGLL